MKNKNASSEIKTIRGLESQLASARAELRLEKQKRSQVEAELQRTERNLEIVLGTKDRITCKRLKVPGKVSKGRASAILCVNDWHAEGCAKRESVDGAPGRAVVSTRPRNRQPVAHVGPTSRSGGSSRDTRRSAHLYTQGGDVGDEQLGAASGAELWRNGARMGAGRLPPICIGLHRC